MTQEIYRTVYQVEVFSRGPFNPDGGDGDPFDLAEINYAITEGDCIGDVSVLTRDVVPTKNVRDELVRIGNDGSFFDDDEDEDEVVTGPPEILDPHFSVFNSHINKASDRADEAFISAFGQDAWKEHIAPLHETGIMAIFDSAPTEHTRFWVYTVTNFVNEGKPDYTPLEVQA